VKIVLWNYRLTHWWMRILLVIALVTFTLVGIVPVQATPIVTVIDYGVSSMTLQSTQRYTPLNIRYYPNQVFSQPVTWTQVADTNLYSATVVLSLTAGELWFTDISADSWTGLGIWKPSGRGVEYKPLVTVLPPANGSATTNVRVVADDRFYLVFTTPKDSFGNSFAPGDYELDTQNWTSFEVQWDYDVHWSTLTVVNRNHAWIADPEGIFHRAWLVFLSSIFH
jgi:hypothetical protein